MVFFLMCMHCSPSCIIPYTETTTSKTINIMRKKSQLQATTTSTTTVVRIKREPINLLCKSTDLVGVFSCPTFFVCVLLSLSPILLFIRVCRLVSLLVYGDPLPISLSLSLTHTRTLTLALCFSHCVDLCVFDAIMQMSLMNSSLP